MRKPGIIAILVLAGTSLLWARNPGTNAQPGLSHRRHVARVQISTPSSGATVEGETVSIQYKADNTTNKTQHFQLQLDSQSPIETADTTYTFDQLTPGDHTIAVALLSPKGTLIEGSEAHTDFSSVAPEPSKDPELQSMMPPTLQKVAMFLPKTSGPSESPDGSAEMPLLSVIGLGVLVGGIVSAMKTRG